MTDSGFVKAQSNNLPKIDILFVMSTFFASNPDFTSAEIKEESCKAICISICLTSSINSEGGMTEDLLEQVLRIPNPYRVLNSVLGGLERNKAVLKFRQIHSDEEDCDQPSEVLPEYTESLEDSSKRELKQSTSQILKHYPICHLERRIRRLNTNKYEYRPAYYEEVICVPNISEVEETNEVCSSLGFSCVQWNKTIHLTRRPYSSDCWETKTMVIPAGCECMWPVHRLGDMALHV